MRIIIMVALALLSPAISRAAIEFAGYMKIAGDTPKFVLLDSNDRNASGWIAIGQAFKEHTIVGFDQKKEVLSVRKGEVVFNLPLNAPRIAEDSSEMRKAIDASIRSIRSIRDIPVITTRW